MVEDDETKEYLMLLQAHCSFGEVSFLCNTPQTCTVRVRELSRVLRLDKQCFKEILEICFFDGRIIVKNLLEVN
jgi:CRP-like cAMP-binding protein